MSETPSKYPALDTAVSVVPHLEALKRSGVETIFRYLNPLGASEKQVTPSEARAIASAGLSLGLVSEGWGDFAHGALSAAAGQRDAEHALAQLPLLGASEGAGVYFAVDTDASEQEISKLVLPYFVEVRRVLAGKYRVGVYGSGLVCSRVLNEQLASLAWLACSLGWRESREFLASGKWAISQKLPSRVPHFDFDPDDVRGDCGAFTPFAAGTSAVPPPAPDPLALLVSELSGALARGEQEIAKLANAAASAAAPEVSSLESQVASALASAKGALK